jgi:tryptophanyl-tRNA synthetase
MKERKQILSCIQPTGDMHFGNYFGAVQNWVKLQSEYDCFYGIVDYHAMTMPYNPKKLRENVWDLIINLMASGIRPENIFIQSLVPEHAELNWIFNCFCSYGQLTRMTQFKDKSQQSKETSDDFISTGLLTYPVLQAADILIYQADYVPVGKDQVQHLELSRNIAQRFNNQVGKEYFVLPEALLTEIPKVMSTADPTRKMSKSAGEKHYINAFADEARIRKQIRSAVTDAGDTPEGEMSPGLENLFSLLKACDQHEVYDSLMEEYNKGSLRYVELKDAVADALVAINTKLRDNKEVLLQDRKTVKQQIKASAAEIRKHAQKTIREVKELTGLQNVKF